MTASDLTPRPGTTTPTALALDKPAQGMAAFLTLGRNLADAMAQAQTDTLHYLRRKQERDVEFLGALTSAQNPVAAAGTVMDYWQTSLTDWMTEATRRVLDAPKPAIPDQAERIGVLAGPVAPIPGAPDSAPSVQAQAGGKTRANPV